MTNTQGLTSPTGDESREHVLSSDCWCNPTVISYAEVKQQGDTTAGWLTEREAWLTGNDGTKPRTWRAGDPEPEDFPTVTSPSGANEFAHREGGWFHTSGCTCCVDIPWDELVRQCGPLTEVTTSEAGA